MQVSTTMRYHPRAVRITIMEKSENYKCSRRRGEKGTLVLCWWACKLLQSICKTVGGGGFLKKLKIELSYDLVVPLLVKYMEKIKTLILKDTCVPMFIATVFTITNNNFYNH